MQIPYFMSLGETDDESLAYEHGKVMALYLKSKGINCVLLPA